jgi:hypothetical protein
MQIPIGHDAPRKTHYEKTNSAVEHNFPSSILDIPLFVVICKLVSVFSHIQSTHTGRPRHWWKENIKMCLKEVG